MQGISEYIGGMIIESDLDNIISRNLNELSDNDVIETLRDYVGDNIDPTRAMNIWYELKKKLGHKTSLWQVPSIADIDKYDQSCHKWAKNIIKKYKFDADDEDILVGIAYMVNGL